ncbi:PREDICTED: eclosion hormone [Papilio polytes]|uniref:eclosion hormone n=1 Tax=Papilio polytes TaxID=76194 RepID=UPI000676A266|nr:PREDICTED: eclosion hormone [Papilio polytes]
MMVVQRNFLTVLSLMMLATIIRKSKGNPAIATGYDPMDICIENCAQCKKMLGSWFEGQLCAESCIKYKGKLIVECEDFASISPFLNKVARLPGKRG